MRQLKNIIKEIEKKYGRKNDLRQTFNEIVQSNNHGWLTGGGKQVYFYDDNPKNKKDDNLCPNIKFHLMHRSDVAKKQYDSEFLNLFDASSDAYTIAEIIVSKGRNKYDPEAGKKVRRYNHLSINFYDHVKRAAKNKDVDGFVFDWDHTLQILGSMHYSLQEWNTLLYYKKQLPPKEWNKYKNFLNISSHDTLENLNYSFNVLHVSRGSKTPNLLGIIDSKEAEKSTIDALSIVHAGGVARRKKLQSMFRLINKHKKFVVILSKNKKIKRNPNIFNSILHKWGCKNPVLTYSKNKYRFMKSLKQLSKYCLASPTKARPRQRFLARLVPVAAPVARWSTRQ